jgi:excinuclease ABC subunit A
MLFSENFTCTNCGVSIAEIQPRTSSFNSPHGACDRCDGLGSRLEIDPELLVPNEDLSVNEGAIVPWANSQTEYHGSVLQGLAEKYGIDLDARWCELPDEHKRLIFYGTQGERIYVSYRKPLRAEAAVHEPVRRGRRKPRAALRGDGLRVPAREDRRVS